MVHSPSRAAVRAGRVLAATALALLATASSAVTLTTLPASQYTSIFGTYAPQGDCTREPRVAIEASGMTFTAGGRSVKPPRIEQSLTFFGPSYAGTALAFFPFRSDPASPATC